MRCKIDEKEDNPGEYVMEEGEKMNLGVNVSVNEKDRKTSMLRRVEVVIKVIFQAMLPRRVVRKMLYSLNWHCQLRQSEIKEIDEKEDKVKEANPVEENTDDTNKQILNEEILI